VSPEKEWCGNMINMLNEIDQMQSTFVAAQKLVAVQGRKWANPIKD
jgi:hypothetical protein